ncbi:PH domain-containing protein [Patescibacteria group bacterium]|nr:PH domain-containing protein [Patescibacteria group bacterium]
MNEIITEKKYPIQKMWILKSAIRVIIYSIPVVAVILFFLLIIVFSGKNNAVAMFLLFFLLIFIPIVIGIGAIFSFLLRLTFHYSVEDNFLTLNQGILSRQQRHIPYGVIQNLFIRQDLLDRIFGLASLTIENASQGAGAGIFNLVQTFRLSLSRGFQQNLELVGFSGNKVNIPGLTKQNAETLKEIILQKMKENPIEDSRSGL